MKKNRAEVYLSRSSERILIWFSCGAQAEIFDLSRATSIKLAAPINFIRGVSVGELDSFWLDFVSASDERGSVKLGFL